MDLLVLDGRLNKTLPNRRLSLFHLLSDLFFFYIFYRHTPLILDFVEGLHCRDCHIDVQRYVRICFINLNVRELLGVSALVERMIHQHKDRLKKWFPSSEIHVEVGNLELLLDVQNVLLDLGERHFGILEADFENRDGTLIHGNQNYL